MKGFLLVKNVYSVEYIYFEHTERGGFIDRAQASRAEHREFGSRSCQANNVLTINLSLPTLALGITRIEQ